VAREHSGRKQLASLALESIEQSMFQRSRGGQALGRVVRDQTIWVQALRVAFGKQLVRPRTRARETLPSMSLAAGTPGSDALKERGLMSGKDNL
jgi:hypothetical protein